MIDDEIRVNDNDEVIGEIVSEVVRRDALSKLQEFGFKIQVETSTN